MQCRNFIVFFYLFCVAAAFVFAQEQDESKNENKVYSGKQNSDWEAAQSELGNIKGKLDAQESRVRDLIVEKGELKGEDLALRMDELKVEYRKLQAITESYNKLNQEYLTKFPERGIKDTRVYKRIKIKSLQSFEEDLTVQGSVNRLQDKILKQYPRANEDKKNKKIKSTTLQNDKTEDLKKPDQVEVIDQIILKK